MSDTQFAALLAALTTVGGALVGILRWSVLRIVKALDANTETLRDHAKVSTRLEVKVEQLADRVEEWWEKDHTPVDTPSLETQKKRGYEAQKKQRRTKPEGTPIGGAYSFQRPKTSGGGEGDH